MIIAHIILYFLLVAFIYHLIRRDGKYVEELNKNDVEIQSLKQQRDALKYNYDKLLKLYNISVSKLKKLQPRNKGHLK